MTRRVVVIVGALLLLTTSLKAVQVHDASDVRVLATGTITGPDADTSRVDSTFDGFVLGIGMGISIGWGAIKGSIGELEGEMFGDIGGDLDLLWVLGSHFLAGVQAHYTILGGVEGNTWSRIIVSGTGVLYPKSDNLMGVFLRGALGYYAMGITSGLSSKTATGAAILLSAGYSWRVDHVVGPMPNSRLGLYGHLRRSFVEGVNLDEIGVGITLFRD